jgi:hypothetical protein
MIAPAISAFYCVRLLVSRQPPNSAAYRAVVASISDNPEIHILGAQVYLGSIYEAFHQSVVLNKKAALWSTGSLFFAALTFALPLFGQ